MALISISGKIGSGKDTIATIIQYLTSPLRIENTSFEEFQLYFGKKRGFESTWQIKRFADKVKDIVCLLINCTREQLENRDFKEYPLGEEWDLIVTTSSYGARPEIRAPDGAQWAHDTYVRMTPRLLLQLVGTNCGRDIIHPNLWVNSLFSEYKGPKMSEYNPSKWIIPDMRFPNELKAVQEKGGLIIRIERPNKNEITLDDLSKTLHPSETSLDHIKFENVIINDGTIEDLIYKVKELLTKNNII